MFRLSLNKILLSQFNPNKIQFGIDLVFHKFLVVVTHLNKELRPLINSTWCRTNLLLHINYQYNTTFLIIAHMSH